jgi:hypothetical protein
MAKSIQYLLLNTLLLCSSYSWANSLIPYAFKKDTLATRVIASTFQDLLTITIACEWNCQSETSRYRDELQAVFSAKELGLSDGNGRLLTPLTNTLKFWSEDICINIGAKSCGSLSKLDDFKVLSLSSCKWSAPELKFSCDENQEYILSPFSPELEFGLSHLPAESWIPVDTLSGWEEPFDSSHKIDKISLKKENCQFPVEAIFCFGDCVYVEGKGESQFLATPKHLGSSKQILCMDELAVKLQALHLSADVLRHACESYAFKLLKQNKATGMTCSSSRLTANCDHFIEKLLK